MSHVPSTSCRHNGHTCHRHAAELLVNCTKCHMVMHLDHLHHFHSTIYSPQCCNNCGVKFDKPSRSLSACLVAQKLNFYHTTGQLQLTTNATIYASEAESDACQAHCRFKIHVHSSAAHILQCLILKLTRVIITQDKALIVRLPTRKIKAL